MSLPVRKYKGMADAFQKLHPIESQKMPFRDFSKNKANVPAVSVLSKAVKEDVEKHRLAMEQWKKANPQEAIKFEALDAAKQRRRGGRRKRVAVEDSQQFKQMRMSTEKADLEKLIVRCDQDIQLMKSSMAAMHKKLDENIKDCAIIKAKHDQTIKCARELSDKLGVLVAAMNTGTHSASESDEDRSDSDGSSSNSDSDSDNEDL
jgi:hypothetical protein